MTSPAWHGNIPREGCLKQRFLKFLCAVFLSLLLFSPFAIFQACATPTSGIQIVDSSGRVGLYASLALDSSDNPHISYYDFTNNDLKYAACTESSWNIQTVDSEGFVGLHTSIALDSSDNPHISYDAENGLKYASWNGTTWDIQTVDSGGSSFTSIAFDKNGNPHISYFHVPSGGHLRYASWTGSSWSIEVVDSAGIVGEFTSLTLDAENKPHISYYDALNGDLKYAWRDGSGWNVQTVDTTGDVGKFSSVVLDSNDIAHIAYCDASSGDLKYAESVGSSWNSQIAATGNCTDSSLALDSNGKPHISYADNSDHRLKYASWTGSEWSIQTLDSAGYVGEYTSLSKHFTSIELDRNDNAHIAFCDVANRLKYALSEDSSGFPAKYVQTIASVSVEPNPIGVGQVAWIHKSITPLPPSSSDTFSGYTLTITKPDGTVIVEGPYASAVHEYLPSSVLKPDIVGTYTLRLSYSGQYFASQDVNYLPAQSETITLHVQKDPVPKTWYIDDDSPSEFASYSQIQPAINRANPGDTLYVRTGTYYGGFVVDKSLSLIGEIPLTPVINGSSFQLGSDITISAKNVNMTGFTISGSRSIYVTGSNCTFFHNNFMGSIQVVANSPNFWDIDYPSGGNYWSDYNGTDANSDGIGDTPYVISANNIDRYPLMKPFGDIPPSPTPSPGPSPAPAPAPTPAFTSILQQKGLTILKEVVGIDVSKYTITAEENQYTAPDGVATGTVFYTLMSDSSRVTALLEFTSGNLMMIHMLDIDGPLYLTKPQTNVNAVELAEAFLCKYQTYTGDSVYGQLMHMLDGMFFIPSNFTKTSGNAVLEVTGSDSERPWFKWYYTSNGASAPYSKFIALGFRNGFLEAFVDKWQLYKIGSTEVDISEKEAIAIALEAAKAHAWSPKLDNDAFSPENFGEKNVRWTALLFDGALDTDKTHSGGSSTLYPVWRVGIALNKWYGNMYGIEVDIWADNGEVRSVQEAWSMMPPPEESATPNTSSPSPDPTPTPFPTTSPSPTPITVAPEFPSLMILPTVIVATLVGGLFCRKKIIKGGEA